MVDAAEFNGRHFETRGIAEVMERVPCCFSPMQDQHALVNLMLQKLGNILESRKQERGEKLSIEKAVTELCEIPYDTYKKVTGSKRRVTRFTLAKFVVGLKLPLEVANELFRLQDGELNETNDFDYIVIHALTDRDDLQNFRSDVEKYTKIKWSREM
jgi:hypothetical protein